MSFLEDGKGCHHCLVQADMEQFVNGNTGTEART